MPSRSISARATRSKASRVMPRHRRFAWSKQGMNVTSRALGAGGAFEGNAELLFKPFNCGADVVNERFDKGGIGDAAADILDGCDEIGLVFFVGWADKPQAPGAWIEARSAEEWAGTGDCDVRARSRRLNRGNDAGDAAADYEDVGLFVHVGPFSRSVKSVGVLPL